MTQDNINTRRHFQEMYGRSHIDFILVALECLDMFTHIMKSDDMVEVRNLMDEKIPVWK
jgi:hypothetical protein